MTELGQPHGNLGGLLVKDSGHSQHVPNPDRPTGLQPRCLAVSPLAEEDQSVRVQRGGQLHALRQPVAEPHQPSRDLGRRAIQSGRDPEDMPQRHRLVDRQPGRTPVESGAEHQEVVRQHPLGRLGSVGQTVTDPLQANDHLPGRAFQLVRTPEHMAHRCPVADCGQFEPATVVIGPEEQHLVGEREPRKPQTVRHAVTELLQSGHDVFRALVKLARNCQDAPGRDHLTGFQPRPIGVEVTTQKDVVVLLDGLRHDRALEGVPELGQSADHILWGTLDALGRRQHLPEPHRRPGGQPFQPPFLRSGQQQVLRRWRCREHQMVCPADAEHLQSFGHGLRCQAQPPGGEENMPERHRLLGVEPGEEPIDVAAQHREVQVIDLLRDRLPGAQNVPQLHQPGRRPGGTAAGPPGGRQHMSQWHRTHRIHPGASLGMPGLTATQLFVVPSQKALVGGPGYRNTGPVGDRHTGYAAGGGH